MPKTNSVEMLWFDKSKPLDLSIQEAAEYFCKKYGLKVEYVIVRKDTPTLPQPAGLEVKTKDLPVGHFIVGCHV